MFYRFPVAGRARRRARYDVPARPFAPVRERSEAVHRDKGVRSSSVSEDRRKRCRSVFRRAVGRSVSAVLPFRGPGLEMPDVRRALCAVSASDAVFRKMKGKSVCPLPAVAGGGVAVAIADCGDRAVHAGPGCVSAFSAHRTDRRQQGCYSSCRASRLSVTRTLSMRAASMSTISKSKSRHESFSPVHGICFSSWRINPLSVL